MNPNFENYLSPFSWRYGSSAMRNLFSEVNKRKIWRSVWVALAKSENKYGLVSKKELADIENHQNEIDIKKALSIEEEIKHDLMAEVKTFASQAKTGGGKIHFGATSQDIEDNADAIIFKKALDIIENDLKNLLKIWEKKILQNKDLVCMSYTHLQPAEPTTLGHRFSIYAQDLLMDLELLNYLKLGIKGKGLKGAVGNSASYVSLLETKAKFLEKEFLKNMKINAFEVTGQVYPRKQDFLVLTLLSSIAQSLHKFAFDLRIMQSAPFGEIMEPFAKKQVGSSAMPFKRNPQNSERVCSLARYIVSLSRTSWDNAANSLLERTLDDSASRRIIIPEGFLATDEILVLCRNIVEGMNINKKNIERNLLLYGPFSALESILLKSTKGGANRQEIHELLREHSMKVYRQMEETGKNNLFENLKKDKQLLEYLTKSQIEELASFKKHIGFAAITSAETARRIKRAVS